MNRRTFVLLSGATSGSLLGPLRPPAPAPAPDRPNEGRLAFEFDDRHRWSLWYRGGGTSVPLLPPADAGVRLDDRLVTLGDLEDVTVQAGSPAAGQSTVLRGRAAGVFLEATFLVLPQGTAPRASLTLRIYPDTRLPMIAGVVWGAFPIARILPGPGDLIAQTDGGLPMVRALTPSTAPDIRSSGLLALTRRNGGTARALAAVDGAEGPGTLDARASGDGLSLETPWRPPRVLSTAGDTESVTLCYAPGADGTAALTAAFTPGEGDRALLGRLVPPAGVWIPAEGTTDEALPGVLASITATLDPRFAPFVCFESPAPGPRGHRWRTDQIHAAGLRAALSWAPFAPGADPGGAEADIRERSRRAVQDWGYDALLLESLDADPGIPGPLTRLEGLRAALAAVRQGAGADVVLWSATRVPQTGALTVVRVGRGPAAGWSGVVAAAELAGRRTFDHRNRWLNDPGPITLGDPLTLAEARTWLGLAAVWGGATVVTADVLALPDPQLDLVRRTLPPAPVAGRPLDAVAPPDEELPAVRVGESSIPLSPWREVSADHPDVPGVVWYEARFAAPAAAPAGAPPILALGRIPGADQTLLNGRLVGATGRFGRGDPADALVARRYAVPTDAVRWGEDNILTLRVWGAGGTAPTAAPAGPSGPAAPPPSLWIAQAASDWWTALVVNWEPTAVARTLRHADLALPPGRYHVYDVWNGVPLRAGDPMRVPLAAHDSAALAFRAYVGHPVVVGSSRHVVCGAVDVAGERWDPKTRTLSATARNLDGRPYAVTVATAGAVPLTRAAGPPTLRMLDSEYVVLEWPGGQHGDLDWQIVFGPPRARRPGHSHP